MIVLEEGKVLPLLLVYNLQQTLTACVVYPYSKGCKEGVQRCAEISACSLGNLIAIRNVLKGCS